MPRWTRPDDAELRERLDEMQYRVTQENATERAFTGEYWNRFDPGTYHCAGCGTPLFEAEAKYDHGCGWPAFTQAIEKDRIGYHEDRSFGMRRVEVTCRNCGGHLGHVFKDGPPPTHDRYCINSASVRFDPKEG